MSVKRYITTLLVAFSFFACGQITKIEIPEIISDGMIIQQNSHMTIWGKALPGSYVSLKTDWDFSNTATASYDSVWTITFPTIKADNKPHKLTITTSDTTIILKDILLGEVWLASGQSNMVMPLEGMGTDTVEGSAAVIAAAKDSYLRMFSLERNITWKKNAKPHGKWVAASPSTAGKFSAAAYFFAKTLRDSLKVPVGIINASFRSTPSEAWTSDKQLLNSVDYGHKVANLPMLAAEMDEYIEWLHTMPRIKLSKMAEHEGRLATISVNDEFVTSPTFDCSQWSEMRLPVFWDDDVLGDFDGVVWFIKKLEIPRRWIGKTLTLCLGAIDDCDMTYVNGVNVGGHSHAGEYDVPREYSISGKYITDTQITIAIRVTDTGSRGGFAGCEGGMRIQLSPKDAVSLEGNWKYRPAGEFFDERLVLFDPVNGAFYDRPRPSLYLSGLSPAAAYYGMIYPIANYTVNGVLWAQGEGNIGRATQYEELLPLLINSFRDTYSNDKLPFIFAQLPSWNYGNCNDSKVANLREAQRRVAQKMDNCYMYSSTDLGSPYTAHSSLKKQSGNRFARLALYHVYGYKNIVPCGPVLTDAAEKGQFLTLTFDNADGLYVDESRPNQFEIAGADGEFFPATAVVQGNTINLFSHAVSNPKYVRYIYKNCALPTLFNGEGLPAEGFMYVDKLEN